MRVKVTGLENIDRKAVYVFASNHSSQLDITALQWGVPNRLSMIFKKNNIMKNKTLKVMFYAKKVSEEAMLYVNIKVKTGNKYDNRLKRYQLGDKWQQYDFNLSLPSNAEGLTMSFKTGVGEEIKMDGFIITAAN